MCPHTAAQFSFMQGIFIMRLKYKQCPLLCTLSTHRQRSRVFANTYITRDNQMRVAGEFVSARVNSCSHVKIRQIYLKSPLFRLVTSSPKAPINHFNSPGVRLSFAALEVQR